MQADVSQASSKNSSDNEGTYNSGYEIWHITSGIDSDSSEHQGSSQGSNGRYRQATAIGRYCQATSNSMTSKKHKMVAEGRAATDRAFEKLRQDVGVGVSSGDNNKDNDEEEENMRTVPDTPENRVNGSLAAKSPQQRVGGAPRKREAKIAPDPSASTPLPKLSFHSSPQCLGSQALYVKGSPHIEPPPCSRSRSGTATADSESTLSPFGCWNQTSPRHGVRCREDKDSVATCGGNRIS